MFQGRPHYQALGVKHKKKNISDTHMHTDCILIVLFPVCMNCCVGFFFVCVFFKSSPEPRLKELTPQFKNKPKAQKAHIHIHLTSECFDVHRQNIATFFFFFFFFFKENAPSALWINMKSVKTQKILYLNLLNHRLVIILCIDFSVWSLLGTLLMEQICWWVPQQVRDDFFSRGCGAPR